MDGINILESVDIGGIGQYTHIEIGIITGTGRFGPETQLQCVNRIDSSVHRGQHCHMIVTISACSSVVVPIQSFATTRSVVVGGTAVYIGVAAIRGTIVQSHPAVGESTAGGTGACRGILKVVEERQYRDFSTRSMRRHINSTAGVVNPAICSNRKGVSRRGKQSHKGVVRVV